MTYYVVKTKKQLKKDLIYLLVWIKIEIQLSIIVNSVTSIPERSKGLLSSGSAISFVSSNLTAGNHSISSASWSIFLSPVGGARVVGNPVQFRTGKGARINRDLAQWKRDALITQRSQDRNLESRKGEHGNLSIYSNSLKTLRLKVGRHCASQVRILPRVYALVCKRSKQVC